jgi:metal transporter CNNM
VPDFHVSSYPSHVRSDATPLRNLPLHKVNCVPNNMSLLAILDRFQDGRSHMVIVSRRSEAKAASIKHQVKKGLTERLKERVGMGDSSDSESDSDSDSETEGTTGTSAGSTHSKKGWKRRLRRKASSPDVEKGEKKEEDTTIQDDENKTTALPQSTWAKLLAPGREQAMPADAVMSKNNANEVCIR